ncbi:putative N-acetyltransferase 8B [Pteropus medius]|uniref:putative N-acetyltransferase 8B n=1 Tax=Pteropus vampyrus TaxID=132908 RepID=UPI00196B0101|nr:putative N-acetyltransferase 8B [Pteropus giganteus]
MAPYHIRKYRESDRKSVLDLYSQGVNEHAPITFCHMLKLPRTQVVLLGVPLALFLGSGSWLLALMAGLTLLAALRFLAKIPWTQYVDNCLDTDMSDITKTYLSKPGSCFWVAESEGQVVGMVGALPAEEPTLRKKQVELFHLSVASECRGQGIAKALVRTLLQFARDQGYSEVVLATTMLQVSALALYESMGFQKRHQYFYNWSWALIAVNSFELIYRLPSAQVAQALQERGEL